MSLYISPGDASSYVQHTYITRTTFASMLPISRNSGLRSNPNWANLLEKGFAIPCVVTATAASARVEYILCEILVSSKQNELCLYQMVNLLCNANTELLLD